MSKASAALKQAEAQAEAQAAPQQGGLTREDTHNDTQRRIAETMTAVKAPGTAGSSVSTELPSPGGARPCQSPLTVRMRWPLGSCRGSSE